METSYDEAYTHKRSRGRKPKQADQAHTSRTGKDNDVLMADADVVVVPRD